MGRTLEQNYGRHKTLCHQLSEIYKLKNEKYGNSFDKSIDEDGLLVSKIRLGDKFNRFSTLIKSGSDGKDTDESITDTLLDLANYALMTVMWLEDKNK